MSSHRDFLQEAGSRLAAQSFANRLVPATEQMPYDVLAVAVGDPPSGPYQLELSFLPDVEASLEDASLMQAFVHLPVQVPAGVEEQMLRFIPRLNAKLPLVGFGWLDDSRMLHYRHVVMLPTERETALHLVVQTTWMISYLLSLFAELLVGVAAGERTPEEALREHPHRHVFDA